MRPAGMLDRIADYGNRADPYPLYAELRGTPVTREPGGTYLVSTYYEILALLHDPRISSDLRNRTEGEDDALAAAEAVGLPPSMLRVDPPAHDRLRRLATRPFGPPHSPYRVDAMRADIGRIAARLVDGLTGRDRIDLVDHFAYPLPVRVICALMGVPHEDEPRFHVWADVLVESIDSRPPENQAERLTARRRAMLEMGQYMAGLIEERRHAPRDDMLSALVADRPPEDPMTSAEVITNAILLFIAGHETTVNLIAGGMLTFLRHPGMIERLRREPGLIVRAVEEVLRYEAPVQMLPQRTALADVEIGGVTIRKGAPVTLLLASGNRDARRFHEPDRFDPDRGDIQHLGFGSGVHICFGAPLARLEAQLALSELVRRLENAKLVADPPPYRQNAVLRGPRHLLIECDGVAPPDGNGEPGR